MTKARLWLVVKEGGGDAERGWGVHQERYDVQEVRNGLQPGIMAVNRQAQVAEREARLLKSQALWKKANLQL